AGAIVRAVVRLAVGVRAAARAVHGVDRFAIETLRGHRRLVRRVDVVALRILARDAVLARIDSTGDQARIDGLLEFVLGAERTAGRAVDRRQARRVFVLPVRTRDAASEVIHETETREALEALRLDVDLARVETRERGIEFFFRNARVAD